MAAPTFRGNSRAWRLIDFTPMDEEIETRRSLLRRTPRPTTAQWLEVTPQATRDLLASFQRTVIEELLRRARSSADAMEARSVIVAGGVACNTGLRAAAQSAQFSCPVYFPTPGLSTDNAAMIAAAFPKFRRGEFAGLDAAAQANLTLAKS